MKNEKNITISEAIKKSYVACWDQSSTYIDFGKNIEAKICWDETTDWDYYSKSYGRPKNYYSNRRVDILRSVRSAKKSKLIKSYPLDSFRGNFLEKIIIDFFGVKPKEYKTQLLQEIQLNPYYRLKKTYQMGGVSLYERTLAKHIVDFCAVKAGVTYHAKTKKMAIAGLKQKITKKIKMETEKLDVQYGIDCGFCRAGILQFAADNNLDTTTSYSRTELRDKINQNPEINKKYKKELLKIAV